VVEALEAQAPPYFGQIIIEHFNKTPTAATLHLLIAVFSRGEDLVRSLFYSNDLSVLSCVCARECSDSEQSQVSECRRSYGRLMEEKRLC